MYSLDLRSNWKFSDVKDNIESLKSQFDEILDSFSYFNKKQMLIALRSLKSQVFSYTNISLWQRERLWETLNNDFEIFKFQALR